MREKKSWFEKLIMKRLDGGKIQVNLVDDSLPQKLSSPRKVAVIGAGLAGMSAASVLCDRGYDVTLFEKNSYLGGKVGAWKVTFDDGFEAHVEHGFHAFFRQYYNLFRMLERIGADRFLKTMEDYLIVTPNGNFNFKDTALTPISNIFSMARQGIFRFGEVLRAPRMWRMFALLSYEQHKTFARFDDISFADFVELASIPKSLTLIFNTFARAFFAQRHLMSMAEVLKSFHFYFLSNAGGLLYEYLDDDYDATLLTPFREYMESRGTQLKLGQSVDAIERSEDQLRVAGETFDAVILATDVKGVRHIISQSTFLQEEDPTLYKQGSAIRASQRYAVLRLWVDLPSQREDWTGFVITDRLNIVDSISFYERLEKDAAAWVDEHGGGVVELHCYAVPDEIETREDVRRLFLEDLYTYCPEYKDATIVYEYLQVRDDFSAFHTGLAAQRPGYRTEVDQLLLAGDWVKLPYPAMLMEAACMSGMLCANAILAQDGLRPEPVFSVPLTGLLAKKPKQLPAS